MRALCTRRNTLKGPQRQTTPFEPATTPTPERRIAMASTMAAKSSLVSGRQKFSRSPAINPRPGSGARGRTVAIDVAL